MILFFSVVIRMLRAEERASVAEGELQRVLADLAEVR